MRANVLIFCSYIALKKDKKIKMEDKVMVRLKMSFLNNCLMVRLNLSSDGIGNCKETNTFVKECDKNIECKKTGILNFAYKQGLMGEEGLSIYNRFVNDTFAHTKGHFVKT